MTTNRIHLTAMFLCCVFVLVGTTAGNSAPILVDGGYTYGVLPSASYPDSGGELTDGTAVVNVWPNPADSAALVGWQFSDPTITFNFSSPVQIGSITSYFADSDGASGVGLPATINISTSGGFNQTFVVNNPAGSGTTVPINVNAFGLTTDNVTLTATGPHEWEMLSEVQFFSPTGVASVDGNNRVLNVEYIYNSVTAPYTGIQGKDNVAPLGSPQSLVDGLGRAGEYTPVGGFWGSGEEGTIFERSDAQIAAGQPQPPITFDLGGVVNLAEVVIHYGLHDSAAVLEPSSVDVLVDGNFVDNFTGFTDSGTVADNTIHSLSLDLLGQSGRYVQLVFYGTDDIRFGNQWQGFTEIEFFVAVPEPKAYLLGLVGVGCVAVVLRRRRHVG